MRRNLLQKKYESNEAINERDNVSNVNKFVGFKLNISIIRMQICIICSTKKIVKLVL